MLRELKTNKFVTIFLKRHLQLIANEFQLKLIDIRVLFYVYGCDKPVIADDMVEDFLCSKAHISMSIKYLEEKGYIYRTPLPSDKRKLIIKYNHSITPIIERAKQIRDKLVEIALEGIEKEKIDIYNEVNERSIENIKKYKEK